MGTLRGLDFGVYGDRFVSDAVQLECGCAGVEISLPAPGVVTLERSVTGVVYGAVPEFSLSGDSVCVFNISGGLAGQFVRVVCSVDPVSCHILL